MTNYQFAAMGTVLSVKSTTHVSAPVQKAIINRLHEIENQFSLYRPQSTLCRLNRQEEPLLNDEFISVLASANDLVLQTNGAFSITSTNELDLNGYVKGWAIEEIAQLLAACGYEDFLLCAGGDITFRGQPIETNSWRIGIENPLDPRQMLFTLEFAAPSHWSVATSGLYRRGEHIRNAQELLSVTVVGREIAFADAYATTVMAMGIEGLAWIKNCDGYEAIAISKNFEVVMSEDFGQAYSVGQYVDEFAALA